MDFTIDYYNLNAENFIENTQNVDMHQDQDRSRSMTRQDGRDMRSGIINCCNGCGREDHIRMRKEIEEEKHGMCIFCPTWTDSVECRK